MLAITKHSQEGEEVSKKFRCRTPETNNGEESYYAYQE
jgi:hypothetical protein